ncbi:MAG: DEAD/DEAH box helicase [Alphaproteobacteria bacterium]|nr:DEAD/DEAH box helicase [Alphaproteobacteria bacterium]
MNFSELNLSENTLKAVQEVGYTMPTPIQEKAIPEILYRNDVIGIAQTGTGKTAAFTLPMIDILSNGHAKALMPRTLILSPTRELAMQIAESFKKYGKYQKLSMALLIGGESIVDQQKALSKGVDVLIATPGRMVDLCERGRVLLRDVQIFVLDEADRMLDMGFIPDVEKIMTRLPVQKQTLLFSATMPPEIEALSNKFMKFPRTIKVDPPTSTAITVEQFVVKSKKDPWVKREVLRQIIAAEDVKNAMVFCNRKTDVDILFKSFTKHEFSVAELHGDMSQSVRFDTLNGFKNGTYQFLICSDVAARGLDLPEVSHVFNFDIPLNSEDYIHRIGRTGRAGKSGRAFTILTSADYKAWEMVLKLIDQQIPEFEVTLPERYLKPHKPFKFNQKEDHHSSKQKKHKFHFQKGDENLKKEQKKSGFKKLKHEKRQNFPKNAFGMDVPAFLKSTIPDEEKA